MIFAKPSTEQEAVNLLNEAKGITRILGGGTDVLVQMKSGVTEPELIVDIKNIPGIKEINQVNDDSFDVLKPGNKIGDGKSPFPRIQ